MRSGEPDPSDDARSLYGGLKSPRYVYWPVYRTTP